MSKILNNTAIAATACCIILFQGLQAYSAPDSTKSRYLKLRAIGDKFTIATKEPIRFYFDNLDESDTYFCLLPTSTPGIFTVELRAGNRGLTEQYQNSIEELQKKNLELQQTLADLVAVSPDVQNAVSGVLSKNGVNVDYTAKTGLEPQIRKGTEDRTILDKQQKHIEDNLNRLNIEYTANEQNIGNLRTEIATLVAQNADPKLIKQKNGELNALLQRNVWLDKQRAALIEERNTLKNAVQTLEMKARINELEIEKQRLIILGLTGFSAVLVMLCYVIYRSYKQKKYLSEQLAMKNADLVREQEVSNALLLNILPPSIAGRLKGGETTLVDYFSHATVVFIDIASFTKLAASITPQELLSLLNEIFSELDSLTEKYGMEKIKTIGDAYMVVSGIPHPREDHARVAASMALEVRHSFSKFKTPAGDPIQARIGIATGEAIAGIIGKKKFIYDLWGDSVNIASRMESTGVIGQIQCTEQFYNELASSFQFTKRGVIEVKGKGSMTTYFLDDFPKNGKQKATSKQS